MWTRHAGIFNTQFLNFTLAFAESIERIPANLLHVKPTIMVAVPRIFEKVYGKINSKIDSNAIQKRLFAWALNIGKKVGELRLQGQAEAYSYDRSLNRSPALTLPRK